MTFCIDCRHYLGGGHQLQPSEQNGQAVLDPRSRTMHQSQSQIVCMLRQH